MGEGGKWAELNLRGTLMEDRVYNKRMVSIGLDLV